MNGDIEEINVITKADHILIAILYKDQDEALVIELSKDNAKSLANSIQKALGH